jgi:hypothetical protein
MAGPIENLETPPPAAPAECRLEEALVGQLRCFLTANELLKGGLLNAKQTRKDALRVLEGSVVADPSDI